MMEVVELNFKYQGAVIEGFATAEEDYNGWTYSVAINDLNFRMYYDDNEDCVILRNDDAVSPVIDEELLNKIMIQIQKQRMRA